MFCLRKTALRPEYCERSGAKMVDGKRDIVEEIKERVALAEIIHEDEPLQQVTGKLYVHGARHNSLVVNTEKGLYTWNSTGESGDVFTWLEKHRGMDFKTAVEYLAGRAKIEPPHWTREETAQRLAARAQADVLTAASKWFFETLQKSDTARAYCEARGWTAETIEGAQLGYWRGDYDGLRAALRYYGVDLTTPAARALLRLPTGGEYGYIIYPHFEHKRERVVYISMRLCYLGNKKEIPPGILAHYNMPLDLMGEKRPFWNTEAIPGKGPVVIVEGQADAVTLGQWGIPALALAGVKVSDNEEGRRLLVLLSKHDRVTVGLDQDGAGSIGAVALAEALGPGVHVVTWPDHDVNDWLRNKPQEATAKAAAELLSKTPTYIEVLAARIGKLSNSDREKGLRKLFKMVLRLDNFSRDVMREDLARAAGLKARDFDRLLKNVTGEQAQQEKDGDGEPLLTITLVGGLVGEHLLETVYQPPSGNGAAVNRKSGKTLFAVRSPGGEVGLQPFFDADGVRYVPPPPDWKVLQEKVVRFAEAPGELLAPRELIREIQAIIRRYVDVGILYETLAAYYVMLTWLYDSFDTLPYLRVKGDYGTGKSRFLQVVGAMCYRPIVSTGAATVSPIFRLLDTFRGTLVLDEADFQNSEESADIVKILNTGYQRAQGVVLRAGSKENDFSPEVFVVYGPKVIATRRDFGDKALESRCLNYETVPTTRDDLPIELPRAFWESEVPHIQGLMLRYRLAYWSGPRELDYTGLDLSLEPRLNQVTLALQNIIDDPELKEDLTGFIRAYNEQLVEERGLTLTAKVLEALLVQYTFESNKAPGTQDFSINSIAERANQLIDFENIGLNDGLCKKHTQPVSMRDKREWIDARKVGDIVRKQLQLLTERQGEQRRYHVVWNPVRIGGLRKRYGLDDAALEAVVNTVLSIEAAKEDYRRKAAATLASMGG